LSNISSTRDRRRNRRRKQNRLTNLIIGSLVIAGVALIAVLVWNSFGDPPLGEQVPPTGSGEHVPDGNPLPQFSSDPPTSGPHYNTALPEGFYEEDSNEALFLPNPQGFIVHSMEHGYVIFWYNCSILAETDCDTLKSDIRMVMDGYNSFKIIAFPWTSTDVPIVATSWGYRLEMEAWDAELATSFIERNRNHSPEPNAR